MEISAGPKQLTLKQLTFKNGYAFTGFAGYHFVPWLAGELELGYADFDLDKLDGSLTVPGVGTATGSFGLNGDISSFFGFGNVILSLAANALAGIDYNFPGGPRDWRQVPLRLGEYRC